MSCNCSSACPDAVPTINRTEVTNSSYPDVDVSIQGPLDDGSYVVEAQVAYDTLKIPWLIRFHFVDSDLVLGKESLTPPEVPGVSQFFKVTDASGAVSFPVSNPNAGTWYICATVVGWAKVSDPMTF